MCAPLTSHCRLNGFDSANFVFHNHAIGFEHIRSRAGQNGASAHVELRAVNRAGHRLPSLNGPCLCVHLDCVAQNLPATLNTETLPIRSAAPGGTASTRNSFSLRFRDCEEESATLACCALICICCFSLVDRSLGALVLHRLYDRPTSPVVTVCLIVKIGGQLSQIRDVTGH